jgi:predicted transcriptional regulator
MDVATFTIRVDDELKNAFTAAAKAKDRTAGQLIRDFMRDYILKARDDDAYEAWYTRKVEAGRADAAAGRVHSSEEVEAHFAKLRADALKKVGEDDR